MVGLRGISAGERKGAEPPRMPKMLWDFFDAIYYGDMNNGLSTGPADCLYVKPDMSHVSFKGQLHGDRFWKLWERVSDGESDPRTFDAARSHLTGMAKCYESNPKMRILARGMRRFYGAQLGWMEAGLPCDAERLDEIRERCGTELAGWKRRNELRVDDYVPDILGGLPPGGEDPWSDALRRMAEESNSTGQNAMAVVPGIPNPAGCADEFVGNGDYMECVGEQAAKAFGNPEANPITDAAIEATKHTEYPPASNANISDVYDKVAERHPELETGRPFVDATMGADKIARTADAFDATKFWSWLVGGLLVLGGIFGGLFGYAVMGGKKGGDAGHNGIPALGPDSPIGAVGAVGGDVPGFMLGMDSDGAEYHVLYFNHPDMFKVSATPAHSDSFSYEQYVQFKEPVSYKGKTLTETDFDHYGLAHRDAEWTINGQKIDSKTTQQAYSQPGMGNSYIESQKDTFNALEVIEIKE